MSSMAKTGVLEGINAPESLKNKRIGALEGCNAPEIKDFSYFGSVLGIFTPEKEILLQNRQLSGG